MQTSAVLLMLTGENLTLPSGPGNEKKETTQSCNDAKNGDGPACAERVLIINGERFLVQVHSLPLVFGR